MPATAVSCAPRRGMAAAFALLALAGVAAPAFGQAGRVDEDQRTVDLARKFQDATPCTLSGATDALKAAAMDATPQEALVALGMLIRTENLCSPVRNAAEELRGTYAAQIAAAPPLAVAVQPVVAATPPVAEAPRQAAAITVPDDRTLVARLQFEVGPPPANLTRGRVSSP